MHFGLRFAHVMEAVTLKRKPKNRIGCLIYFLWTFTTGGTLIKLFYKLPCFYITTIYTMWPKQLSKAFEFLKIDVSNT